MAFLSNFMSLDAEAIKVENALLSVTIRAQWEMGFSVFSVH
jgi:hypothetical protein